MLAKAKLIPRYNWDYGFLDLLKGITVPLRGGARPEAAFGEVFGKVPLFTTSGRASLYAILKALDLPAGSGIGVPLFCCPVVFETIREAGMKPVFIDINEETYTIAPEDISLKRDKLSAVIAVHMFGHPADMDRIIEAANGLPVIEDCAHSLFSTYKGRLTGLLGDASFFSFRSGKYLSVGEGSAIFAENPTFYDAIRAIVEGFGRYNSKSEIVHCTATYIKSFFYQRPWYGMIGLPLGQKLDKKLNLTAKNGFKALKIAGCDANLLSNRILSFREKIERQRENSLYLLKRLSSLPGVFLPIERDGCRSNFYQFPIRMKSQEERDFLAERLLAGNIDAAKYLDEIIDLARNDYGYEGGCSTAEVCSKTVLIIPNHYTLPRRDLDDIVNALNERIRHESLEKKTLNMKRIAEKKVPIEIQ